MCCGSASRDNQPGKGWIREGASRKWHLTRVLQLAEIEVHFQESLEGMNGEQGRAQPGHPWVVKGLHCPAHELAVYLTGSGHLSAAAGLVQIADISVPP